MGNRLVELSAAIKQKGAELNWFVGEEIARRLEKRSKELEAFKLFDEGCTLGEVAEKLTLSEKAAFGYFENWAKEKGGREAIETVLVTKCLKKHINRLQQEMIWCRFLRPLTKNRDLIKLIEEVRGQQQLLRDPSKIKNGDKQWLIAKYSSQV